MRCLHVIVIVTYFLFATLTTLQAALALYDGEAEITGENILQLLAATGNEVSAYALSDSNLIRALCQVQYVYNLFTSLLGCTILA